jgi:hypothetical protein
VTQEINLKKSSFFAKAAIDAKYTLKTQVPRLFQAKGLCWNVIYEGKTVRMTVVLSLKIL